MRRHWLHIPLIILTLAIFSAPLSPHAQPAIAAPWPFFRSVPSAIPLTAAELVNPLRGFYRWNGNENVPLPRKSFDAYGRHTWRELEPTRDAYDFSELDRDIATAASEGRRYSFRVRAMISTSGVSLPDYMLPLMEKGWSHDYNKDGALDTYVPDWNDPEFMDRVGSLIAALGQRYDGDTRVGWLDIGIYGNWGEWHTYSFPYPTPQGATTMTAANRQKIVDMYVAAFPNKRLIMLSDDADTLRYALLKSPLIGWRRDSLGSDHFADVTKNTQTWSLAKDRWKTAPVVTEFINPSQQQVPQSYLLAANQVVQYHVSLVSNGSTTTWANLSAANRAALSAVGKITGYRYALASLQMIEQPQPGRQTSAEIVWCNTGSAPTYDPWQVVLQLRGSDGGVAWEQQLDGDLGAVLPEQQAGGCVRWSERISVSNALPEGDYAVTLIVRDPGNYYPPMTLASTGRQADGSYALGTMRLSRTTLPAYEVHSTYLPLISR